MIGVNTVWALALLTLASAVSAQNQNEPAGDALSRPNILLITADDLNYDSVGVYGCKVKNITPNIDALARQGVRFLHGHVTIAVCQPSRSVLMTGRYPHHNGARGFEPIRRDVPTLTEMLRKAGYLNGILGKTKHLAPADKFAWDFRRERKELGEGRSPVRYYEAVVRFLNLARTHKKPFFLMANSHDPHRPFAGSEQEARQVRNRGKHFPRASRYFAPAEVVVPGFLPDLPQVRKEIAQYYTSVHRCDETVGQILRALRESGLEGNTIVMFLSDNGMALPFAKTNVYLASTRTPWIVRWPGRIKGDRVNAQHFVSGIDFMATVLGAAKVTPPRGMDGRSFLPILLGQKQAGRDHVLTMFHKTAGKREYPMRCLQTRRFGYIQNAWSDGKTVFKNESQSGLTFRAMRRAAKGDKAIAARLKLFQLRVKEELYDFEADPNALRNLAQDPAYSKTLTDMRMQFIKALNVTRDPDRGRFFE